jgi:hypothetical protein
MAACRFDERSVTALVHRCPWFAHRLRTQHGPRSPVPSSRGRLRGSGPPRPGTDRPGRRGKADASPFSQPALSVMSSRHRPTLVEDEPDQSVSRQMV